MVIRFTVSIPSRRIKEFTGQIAKSPPLPEYITKRGPYINGGVGARNRIVVIYEFDKSNLAKAWLNIFNQWDAFGGTPGITFSAVLEEDKLVKECGIDLESQRTAKPFSQNS